MSLHQKESKTYMQVVKHDTVPIAVDSSDLMFAHA